MPGVSLLPVLWFLRLWARLKAAAAISLKVLYLSCLVADGRADTENAAYVCLQFNHMRVSLFFLLNTPPPPKLANIPWLPQDSLRNAMCMTKAFTETAVAKKLDMDQYSDCSLAMRTLGTLEGPWTIHCIISRARFLLQNKYTLCVYLFHKIHGVIVTCWTTPITPMMNCIILPHNMWLFHHFTLCMHWNALYYSNAEKLTKP